MEETAVVDPNIDTSPDLESAMDSFLSDAPPAPGSSPGPNADTPTPEPEGAQDPQGQAQGADPNATDRPPLEGAEEDTSDLPEDWDEDQPIDTTGKKHIRLDVNRFNRIYASHKLARELKDIAPNVETARMHYQRHNDLLDMKADLASGDAGAVDRFLGFWKNESPQGFSTLVNRALEQAPAEVRDSFRSNAIASTIDEAYQSAAQSGDPQDLYRAQMLEWSTTGKYRAKDALPKPADPLAQREAAVTQREQALQRQDAQRVETTVTRVDAQVQQAKEASIAGEVDKLLAPVKDRFTKAPELFEALRDRIVGRVRTELGKDHEWAQNHNRDLRLARQSLQQAIQARQQFDVKGRFGPMVDEFAARARNVMTPIARKLVSEATATLVADNQAKHDKLATSSARREPSGGGAPRRQSLMPNLPAGADLDSKMDAYFRSA